MTREATAANANDVKQCCAQLYESDLARILLGDAFHPGGLRLTERLGELLHLTPKSQVLDVASGKSTSALFLAQRFASHVIVLDYSEQNVAQAKELHRATVLALLVSFEPGVPGHLPFPGSSF